METKKLKKNDRNLENGLKLKRNKPNLPVLENLDSQEMIETLRELHDHAQPYPHVCLHPFIDDTTMRTIYNEAKNNMTATFKVS